LKVHVIVVSWNAREETLGCLRNLEALPEPELRVHVVDNGSTDGSAAAVAREHPEADLLAFQDNRGFAAAANAGLRRALEEGAEWFFLLNNDARLEDGALKVIPGQGSWGAASTPIVSGTCSGAAASRWGGISTWRACGGTAAGGAGATRRRRRWTP